MKISKFTKKISSSNFVKRLSSDKAKKIASISLGSALALLVLVQLFYPRDRALPFTSLAGQSVAGWTRPDIERLSDDLYQKSTIEARGKGKVVLAYTASSVGIEMKREDLVDKVVGYSWWKRLIPGSLLWSGPKVDTFAAEVNQSKLDSFVDANSQSFSVPAENAQLVIENTEAKIIGGSQGMRLGAEQFVDGIKSAEYKLGRPTTLITEFTYTDPALRRSDLVELQKSAQAIIDKKVSLEFEDKRVEADAQTVASWLKITQDQAKTVADVRFTIDDERLIQFSKEQFDKIVVQPAGVTVIDLVDGVEQSRREGVAGRAIDEAKIVQEAESLLIEQSDLTSVALTVPARAVAPSIKKNQTFTKSQAGLQAYVNSLADEGDIRVSVAQLNGGGWSASYRGHEQTVAASTYKVYVVAYALNQIADGKLSFDDEIKGMTFRECMSRTIIQSDNSCPEAMMEKFGRSTINSFLYERGFSRATTFTNGTATQTTANDLVKAAIGIEQGTLVSGSERTFLLDLMARQQYRQGITAGSAGVVRNKVGFLWGYLNDMAIVSHPGGKYAISIMTNNQSWSKIAEITRKVESLMY